MCARHVPAHAEAQCGLEFWSLDLASARVHFLGRVPALDYGNLARSYGNLQTAVRSRSVP